MEKSCIGRCGALIMLLVVMYWAMAWGHLADAATADALSHAEMIAAVTTTSVECSKGVSFGYRHQENVNEQRPSTNGLMVAEDMRCRGCRGKCKAENLKCRSQCAGEDACLAHCEEQLSKCETMCQQLFQCE